MASGTALPTGSEEEKANAIVLPAGYTTGWTGTAQFMQESFASLLFALALGILLIYMTLASQFNHLVHPITIMISLPLSVVGALGGLFVFGKTMSIFSMIGIIMLMSLVTKNAILLIEFALQRRHDGLSRSDALIDAGRTRLRPILMTTAAAIGGMIPIAVSTAEGSETRSPMAVAVIGGLATSTLLTLVVLPVFYTFMDDMASSRIVQFFGRKISPPESEGDHAAGEQAATVASAPASA
jgi:HAE1 family hydrophobic/amphiphilic exporter-1